MIQIKAGPFEGRTGFSVVEIEDSKVTLGLEFLRETNASVMPSTYSLVMYGKKLCIIPVITNKVREGRLISAMQLKKGYKHGEETYLAVLKWDEIEETSGKVPLKINEVLTKFEDVMPEKLPKKLPPRRDVNHKIELLPGTEPSAKAPYRMSQPELSELRKQLKELLDAGLIVPVKSPFGAPVLFQKKQDGSLR